MEAVLGRIPIGDFEAPEVDLCAAWESIWCLPHKFMLAMPGKDREKGGFFIPDKTARRERLPIGVCIAAGTDTDLAVGDHVLVESRYAKVISRLEVGTFAYPGEVWLFGLTSPHVRRCQLVGTRHTAAAVVGHTECELGRSTFPSGQAAPGSMRASNGRTKGWQEGRGFTGEGRLLLRLQEKDGTWNGTELVVPDRMADRPDIGVVASASPYCRHVKEGDTVLYMRRGLESMYPDGDQSLAFCLEKAVYAVVKP